jgi:type I restriction enzyme S subunit
MTPSRRVITDIAELNPRLPTGLTSDLSRNVDFVPMADLSEDGVVRTNETRPLRDVMKGYTYFENGDVVVAKITPCMENGKAAYVDNLRCGIGFGSTEFHVLRPGRDVDGQYLFWMIWGRHFRQSAQANMTGSAGQKRVPAGFFGRYEIPVPALAEQKRIAAILDAANALRVKRRASIDQLDEVIQSTFLEMFGDPVTNRKKWTDTVLLGEVADITSGLTKGRKLRNQSTREVPYLAVVNVQDRHLILDPLKTIEATESEIEKYRLMRNDLLLTEGGDRDKLGRGTLWQDELPECIHQNHIFRLRLHDERLMPVFLNWLVGSDRGKRYFLSQAKQTTGIASINLSQLKRFPLLLPPLQLQQRFASIVEAVESHKVSLRTQCAELDSLFASLQMRAFSGELCSGPTSRRHASA